MKAYSAMWKFVEIYEILPVVYSWCGQMFLELLTCVEKMFDIILTMISRNAKDHAVPFAQSDQGMPNSLFRKRVQLSICGSHIVYAQKKD